MKNPKNSDERSQDCRDLRTALDDQHKKRMEAFEIQFKPIIIRDGPSKKVRRKFVKAIFDGKVKIFENFQTIFQGNFKIQGARVTYDIYSMMLLLRDTTFRAEREGKVMFFFISQNYM